MAYYPLSQIKTNIYTNGNEYATGDGVPYKGYYYKTSTGFLFTGRTPQDPPNQRIYPITTDQIEKIGEFSQLKVTPAFIAGDSDPQVNEIYQEFQQNYSEYTSRNRIPSISFLPYYVVNRPIENDYTIGEFRRYFCIKNNEINYTEIDKRQYDLLLNQDASIMYSLYRPFFLSWILTGEKEEVAKVNKNIVELAMVKQKLPFLDSYLNYNYTKYYKPNLDTTK